MLKTISYISGWLSLGLVFLALPSCLGFSVSPPPSSFNSPTNHRLIRGVPFYPDETNLCAPASLAAVMTFQGRPTEVAEAAAAILRPNLRGSLAPDLVLWARKQGMEARFWAAQPEEILKLIDHQKPVILQINSGLTGLPYKTGHMVVAVGYGPEGLVANSGVIQQSIIPWAEFLTRWFSFGNLAILVEKPQTPGVEAQSLAQENSNSPVPPAPLITLDKPQ